MPIRTRKLSRMGIEKATTLNMRNAEPGGPAKYEWSISQGLKHEVKLTQGQMLELIIFARSWMREKPRDHYTCGCPSAEWIRYNPTTGIGTLLCMAHADLHDQGQGFEVYP